MNKIFLVIMIIILSSCQSQVDLEEETIENEVKTISPLVLRKNDYDSFSLGGASYSLPIAYQDLSDAGLSLNKTEFHHDTIGKNQQVMANLVGEGTDIGASFKNTSNEPIAIEDATIIEVYINGADGTNQDFAINGIRFGDSYTKAKERLTDVVYDETYLDDARTINYYTDKNYVSLHFVHDKLDSAAIFSKAYMRDENYVNGEFVIFGQILKFPASLRDLEELMQTTFDLDTEDDILEAKKIVELKIYSPIHDGDESKDSPYGLTFTIANPTDDDIAYMDGQIMRIKAVNSADLSVGNIYVGASIDELKRVDKKNQKPSRLSIDGKTDDNMVKFSFDADNDTTYSFLADDKMIREIEVIYKEMK